MLPSPVPWFLLLWTILINDLKVQQWRNQRAELAELEYRASEAERLAQAEAERIRSVRESQRRLAIRDQVFYVSPSFNKWLSFTFTKMAKMHPLTAKYREQGSLYIWMSCYPNRTCYLSSPASKAQGHAFTRAGGFAGGGAAADGGAATRPGETATQRHQTSCGDWEGASSEAGRSPQRGALREWARRSGSWGALGGDSGQGKTSSGGGGGGDGGDGSRLQTCQFKLSIFGHSISYPAHFLPILCITPLIQKGKL